MSKHTPGPWRYQREDTFEVGRQPVVRYEVYREHGPFGHPATCETEPDARLIAAAPDLLLCLKGILALPAMTAIERDDCVKAARAAIAKAEGEGE